MNNVDQTRYDGRYDGNNDNVRVELRIDVAAGIVSGDLFLVRPAGDGYVASVRTSPIVTVAGRSGTWPAIWQSADGEAAPAEIKVAVSPADPEAATVTVSYDHPVNGLPVGAPVTVDVKRVGPEFREVGVEMETE